MFFVLSKILVYLIAPLTIICGLFISSAFTKGQYKKRFFYLGLGLLLFSSNDFIANEVVAIWEVPVTPYAKMKGNYEWAILLTGVTKHDDGLHDRIFFNRGADRVTHTVQLYKLGKIKKILVSGGSGRLISTDRKEAEEVAEALVLMGIPLADIVIEPNSRNTHESAEEVKRILRIITAPNKCLLVTSGFHMRRSALCFEKVGWKMDCFSVDFLSHSRQFTPDILFVPKIEAIANWQIMVREWLGIISYKLAGYI